MKKEINPSTPLRIDGERPSTKAQGSPEFTEGRSRTINILIVDDNSKMLETLRDILGEEGYKVTIADSVALAKEKIEKKFYHLALIDLRLVNGSGLDLLSDIRKKNIETMVIIFTAYASLETAIVAMQEGAFSYLQKPLNMEELKIAVKKALKTQELSLENKNLIARLKELSLKEPLTGLYNYRYLMERISSEFKRAKRYILPLSLLMLDIDYFKSINEVYGHQCGDAILKEFAHYLKKSARGNDIVVRYGGEEFVILMPDTSKEGTVNFGRRLLEKCKEHIFDCADKRIKLKISIGVASFPEDGVNSFAGLFDAVDKALHEAKEGGGNMLFPYSSISTKEIKDIMKDGGRPNIDKLKERLLKMKNRANQILLESIYAFAKAVEARDHYTGRHSESMVSIVTDIGRKLRLSSGEIENLQHAAILHDLGKIGIPDNILLKRKKLSRREYEKIKMHPQIGAEIIRDIHILKDVLPMILYHHERYDGLGYSAGAKGKDIPLGARIVAIADVYQALVSNRPYRKACGKKEALKIIEEGSGSQFDPVIVDAFLQIMRSNK